VKLPLLHVIATDDVVEATGFDPLAAELVAAGRDTIALHLRLGRAGSRDFCDRAERLAAAARASGAWCAVNGRVDVALVAGAQAVQLGSGALPVEAVRRIAGTRLAIGASVHSAEEGRTRARDGADYLVAGSVFTTATHPNRTPAGPELVTSCGTAGVPVIAIGGVDETNAALAVAAGATGVAVIRAVWQDPDPVGAALRLIEVIRQTAAARQDARKGCRASGTGAGRE